MVLLHTASTIFFEYIEGQVKADQVIEICFDSDYGHGEMDEKRRLEDIQAHKVWRRVSPEFPFKGLWQTIALESL